MKKKISTIVLILLISLFVIQFKVQATELDMSKFTEEDLITTFNVEGITNYDLTKYNEKNDKRVNIYVFRGDGCRNCKNFYEYYVANKLLVSHGDKIRIISYEIKNNRQNFRLLDEVKTLLNEQSDTYATPTVIIGNKTFSGDLVVNNAQQKQTEIETAINTLYNSNDRYDVIEELTCKNVFTDDTSSITLTSTKKLDKKYMLKANKIDYQHLKLEDTYNYIVAYDISIYNGNVVVPLSKGSYKIRIPINDKYTKYKVGYVKNGKIQENFEATYNNGYIEFTTTHLSEYVVYGTNDEKPTTKPDTELDTETNTKPSTKPDTEPDTKPNINLDNNLDEKPSINQDKDVSTNQNGVSNTANNEEVEKEKNPKTFDEIQGYVLLLVLGCTSMLGSLIIFNKKRI